MKAIKLLLSITFVALLFTACNTHVVKTENLNVRSAPTKNGKVIGQLHYNDRVKVTPHNEAWGQIEYEDQAGYVAMKHVVTKKENFKSNLEVVGTILLLLCFLGGGGVVFAMFSKGDERKRNKDGSLDRRYKENR
jgi:uncharacterized protein YgiM (DUF1202 family)